MRLADLDAVLEIESAGYPQPWSRTIFRDCLQSRDRGYSCWVVECEDKLVGYAVVSLLFDQAQLQNICIDPSYQSNGLGYWFLLALCREANDAGAIQISLEVRASNVAAKALYARAGFTQAGWRKGYYPNAFNVSEFDAREDALVLVCSLPLQQFDSAT